MNVRSTAFRHRKLATRLLVPLLLALALLGCNGEDITSLPEAKGGGPLFLLAASGGTVDTTGTSWFEPCHADGGGANYRDAAMILGPVSSRTENDYGSDPTCLTGPLLVTSFNFQVTADGIQPSVGWVDSAGLPTSPPPGHAATYNVTKVTINITTSPPGPFSFKTLMLYDDHATPVQLLFGDENSGLNLDAQGYPTALNASGAAILQ